MNVRRGPDENELLLAGQLPSTPLDGTVPYAAAEALAEVAEPIIAPVSAEDILAEPDEDLESYWDGILARGALTLATADPKGGKTWLLFGYAAKATAGEAWLAFAKPLRSLRFLVVSEEPRAVVKKRMRRFGIRTGFYVLTLDRIAPGARPEAVVEAVAAFVTEHSIDVVVIDTASGVLAIEDENSAPDVNRALKPWHRLAQVLKVAVLVLHHKSAQGRDARGSTAWRALPDQLVLIEVDGDAQSRRRRVSYTGRLTECAGSFVAEYVPPRDEEPATYRLDTGTVRDLAAERDAARILRTDRMILDFLEGERAKGDAAWLRRGQVFERLGHRHDVEQRLPALVRDGRIQLDTATGRGGAYVYAAVGVPKRADAPPEVPEGERGASNASGEDFPDAPRASRRDGESAANADGKRDSEDATPRPRTSPEPPQHGSPTLPIPHPHTRKGGGRVGKGRGRGIRPAESSGTLPLTGPASTVEDSRGERTSGGNR